MAKECRPPLHTIYNEAEIPKPVNLCWLESSSSVEHNYIQYWIEIPIHIFFLIFNCYILILEVHLNCCVTSSLTVAKAQSSAWQEKHSHKASLLAKQNFPNWGGGGAEHRVAKVVRQLEGSNSHLDATSVSKTGPAPTSIWSQ